MKLKIVTMIAMVTLSVSLCACNKNEVETVEEINVIVSTQEDEVSSDTSNEKNEEETIEETVPTESPEDVLDESVDIEIVDFEEVANIDMDSFKTWYSTSLSSAIVSFPSTQPIEETKSYEIFTEEKYGNYLKTYSDVWGADEDTYIISPEHFEYHHDWYYNISYQVGNMHYYVVEIPDLTLECGFEIDEDNMKYDYDTGILYLTMLQDFNYYEYVSFASPKTADTLDDLTASNRILLTLAMKRTDEYPISKIVIIKPY
jgi:hypothetical protein